MIIIFLSVSKCYSNCICVYQDSRQKFRTVLVEATVKLDEQVKKIGKAVEESKPFWEARRVARQVRSRHEIYQTVNKQTYLILLHNS